MLIRGYLFSFLLLPVALLGQSSGGPVPQISVRSLTIDCAGCQLAQQDQQQIIEAVKSHTYRPDSLNEIAQRVRYGFQSRGYFKVVVSEPSIALLGRGAADEEANVTVSVTEGEKYQLEDIVFTGNTVFPTAELRSKFNLAPGDVFDVDKVRRGLELLQELYASKGYERFAPVPITNTNDNKHTISLHIQIEEGDRGTTGG